MIVGPQAVQEVFLKVLGASAVPDNFRAWIYRIARNHCLNLVRNRERRPAARMRSEEELDEDG